VDVEEVQQNLAEDSTACEEWMEKVHLSERTVLSFAKRFELRMAVAMSGPDLSMSRWY
jgi:hypothetical protein